MGNSITHFYFVRSVLHLFQHVRNVLLVTPALPQEVVSELAYQTHLDRDRINNMFRIFISISNPDCRLTPQLLSEHLPGWSTNPLKSYLRRALFKGQQSVTFPELAKRLALFCPESKFSPAVNSAPYGTINETAFLETSLNKKDRHVRQKLLMLFDLTDLDEKGQITSFDLDRLIRQLLKTTIPDDTRTIIPDKIISEIARLVIISVHERNESQCASLCEEHNRMAHAFGSVGSHRLVISKEMFLSELSKEEFM